MTDKRTYRGYDWQQTNLALEALREDRRFQLREVPLVRKVVARYARDMEDGDTFPPIQVAKIGKSFFVVDGHHRLAAARQIGRASIASEVTKMTRDEARLYTLGTNTAHGQGLKIADRRRILAIYVEERLHLRADETPKSSRQIEREINKALTHPTITKHLRERFGIEPGDPEEDGFEITPWVREDHEPEAPPTQSELLADFQERLRALELLTDQMDDAPTFGVARSAIASYLRRLLRRNLETNNVFANQDLTI